MTDDHRPASVTVRPCSPDDVARVLALVRADEQRATGHPSQLVDGDVRDWWRAIDLDRDSWLVTPEGAAEPVAAGWLERQGTDLGVTFPIAPAAPHAVPPLLDLAEARARALDLNRLHVGLIVPPVLGQDELGARGYTEVRRFYEMAIQLDGPPRAAALPDGVSLHVATPADGPAFHEAISEAFEDHWEHHPLPFDEWWQRRTAAADFDITWWFLLREGGTAVAVIRNEPARNGGVYVASLGVRRPWRGRGLAKALLHHTFSRAWDAGFRRVTLGVDASSPTGATALYRSVGMTTELETAVWERHL